MLYNRGEAEQAELDKRKQFAPVAASDAELEAYDLDGQEDGDDSARDYDDFVLSRYVLVCQLNQWLVCALPQGHMCIVQCVVSCVRVSCAWASDVRYDKSDQAITRSVAATQSIIKPRTIASPHSGAGAAITVLPITAASPPSPAPAIPSASARASTMGQEDAAATASSVVP